MAFHRRIQLAENLYFLLDSDAYGGVSSSVFVSGAGFGISFHCIGIAARFGEKEKDGIVHRRKEDAGSYRS